MQGREAGAEDVGAAPRPVVSKSSFYSFNSISLTYNPPSPTIYVVSSGLSIKATCGLWSKVSPFGNSILSLTRPMNFALDK